MADDFDLNTAVDSYLSTKAPGEPLAQDSMRSSLSVAVKTNPDAQAEAQRVARRTGVPVDTVLAQPDEMKKKALLGDIDFDAYAKAYPASADLLSDVDFAKFAHDDIDNMGQIEGAFGTLKAAHGPKPSTGSTAYGLFSALGTGAELTKQGIRAQFADALGWSSLSADAQLMAERARFRQFLVDPAFESSTAQGLYSGGRSFVQMLPGLVGSIATRKPNVALVAAGLQTETDSYTKYRARGASPEEAVIGSLGEGAIEVATEKLPMGFLVDKLGKVGAGEFIKGFLGRELAGEELATVMQDAIDTAVANPDKTWGEYFAERPEAAYQTALATLVPSALFGGANELVYRLNGEYEKAARADANAKAFEQLNQLAAASKIKQRDPENFKRFIDAANENGVVQDVYIDLNELSQSGIDINALAQASPSAALQIPNALTSGTDVRIPVSEFATALAGTELGQSLVDHLRTDPEGMSRKQAAEFLQTQGDQLQSEVEKVLADKQGDDTFKASRDKVYDNVLGQLGEANRFTADVNAPYASLMANFYSVQAARLGMTPEELFIQHPVKIQAEATTGPQLDQSVFHGSPYKFSKFTLDHIGKGEGAQAYGWGLYFTTNKDIAEFYRQSTTQKGIDTELLRSSLGQSLAPVAQSDPARAIKELESYLAREDLDPAERENAEYDLGVIDQADTGAGQVYQVEIPNDDVLLQWDKPLADQPQSVKDALGVAETSSKTIVGGQYYRQLQNALGSPEKASRYLNSLGIRGLKYPADMQKGKRGENGYNFVIFDDSAVDVLSTFYQSPTENKPEFYSALQRNLESLNQPKGSPEQWAGIIKNLTNKGVKQEEIDWTGVLDWLKEQKGSVTKEQVLDYLRATAIRVEEVLKQPQISQEDEDLLAELEDRPADVMGPLAAGGETKFEKYTLPGGENYRELLMTLPENTNGRPRATARELAELAGDNWEELGPNARQRYEDQSKARGTTGNYKSAHYDEPNILAHIRFNERRDADGKRVMFIEEVQSDWHQAGRDKGYKVEGARSVNDVQREIDALLTEFRSRPGVDYAPTEEQWNANPDIKARFEDLAKQRQQAINLSGVPDAPFKTSWPELAFKRALMWAVENNFDRVAWTTGEQQAERYDLSKHINSIGYQKRGELYNVTVWDKQDAKVLSNQSADKQWLVDNIGKEMADKIEQGTGRKDGQFTYLEDLDLKVGGEGMKGFYDKMLPSMVNKLVKKWGGKVGQTKIRSGYGVEEEIRARIDVDGEVTVEWGSNERHFKTEAEADAFIKELKSAVPVHSLDITPAMRDSIQQGLPLFQGTGDMRGSFNPSSSTITLLRAADLSTFLHESGHFFLETMNKIALQENAPPEIKADMETVFNWFGVKDLAAWNALTLEQQRPFHEQFARGFEAYLFEGNAPSIEMRGVFQRFRAWLLNVYQSMKNLNVKLNDDVRGVFDRMLASSEQIKETEQLRRFEQMFKDAKEAGMNEAEWKEYQALANQATQDAISNLETRSLRDMKWLSNKRSRVLRDLQRDARTKRKAVRKEVSDQVMQEPVYQAKNFLKRRKVVGEEADAVAEMFGFTSGDHLNKALAEAENMNDKIEALTDQRMLERYGDLTDPTTIARAADAAVHNEARTRFIATEMNALQKAVGGRKILASAAKEYAQIIVNRLRIRDLKPTQYTAAEVRAAKASEKARAEGDLQRAAVEKRNQLIQNYATRAAYDAQADIEKGLRYLQKFSSESRRKSIDTDYLDQIDALLDRFDLRKNVSLKAIDKRKSLAAWVADQEAMGLEPEIDPAILDEANRKHYKDMTVEEMRGLLDTVRQIEHLGRLKNKLLTAKDNRDFATTVERLVQSIEAEAGGKVANNQTRANNTDRAIRLFKGFLASHRKVSSLVRELDGFKDGGPMWETFVRTMNEAGDREASMREEATKNLAGIVTPVVKAGKMGGKGIYFDTIGRSLNREERIGIALNMGNLGNYQRLLDGEGWTPQQIAPVLDSLTKEDWDFAQKVWDFFETYRPQIAAKEKRIYGKEPNWVEPHPVTTKFGEYRGGYYPIKYDSRRSAAAEQFNDAETAKQQLRGAFTSSTTRRSFTKARADEVKNRPLLYSLDGLFQGVNEVIHDLSWHEWLIDANRLMRSRSLDNAIRSRYGAEVVGQFKSAITDIAAGEMPANDALEKVLGSLRTGSMVASMGFNIMNSIINTTGVTQSMVRIGPKWVAMGVGEWARNPRALARTIHEKSEFMRLRSQTQLREINEIRSRVQGKTETRAAVDRAMFFPLALTQLAVDTPTWWGAYQKALVDGNEDARAVALADQAVLDSQSGGQIKDLAAIQRGGPVRKLLTTFYGYFSSTYNLSVEAAKKTDFKDPLSVMRLGGDYLLLYSIPAALGTLLKAALTGGDDWDDPEKLAKKLANDQISYMLGTVVGLREVTGAVQKAVGVQQFDSAYGGPAGLRFFQEIDKLGQQVGQGELDRALMRSVINVAGVTMHLPSTQINRTIDGIAALSDGRTNNPLTLLTGAPPK